MVNLRKEEYAEDSRIPTIEFGTAEEDAFRRDLTINSLFYNINEDKVEDLTKKGIDDLKNGIIRTPLEPFTTFKDDPLRILRVFRFSSRYSFKCDEAIPECIKTEEIKVKKYLIIFQQAFSEKISKERVGKEVEQALKHKNNLEYLNSLHNVGLWPIIFSTPNSLQEELPHEALVEIFQNNSSLWGNVSKLAETALKITENMEDIEERRLTFILSALLYNFVGYTNFPELKKSTLLEYHIIKSLKLNKKLTGNVLSVCQGVQNLREIVERGDSKNLETLGIFIREFKGYWPYSVYLFPIICHDVENGEKIRDEIFELIDEKGLAEFYKVKCIINVNFYKELILK